MAVVPTFTFENFRKELEKDKDLVAEAVKTIRTTVKLRGPQAVQRVIGNLPKMPVDRGTYRRSFQFEDIPNGAVAYNFQLYAPIIEYGRRPGAKMPPVAMLFEWVKRHRIGAELIGPAQQVHGPHPRGRRGNDRRDAVERQQWGIALQIARAIKARGLPARLILETASEIIADDVERELDKALRRDDSR